MRTVNELRSLAGEAGRIWTGFFTRMGFWFCLGFAVQLGANLLSVRLGAQYNVVAPVVFVVGLIASVVALILMIHACEPALRTVAQFRDQELSLASGTVAVPHQVFRHEPVLDVLAMTVGPFLAVYAVWGLVDDEVSWRRRCCWRDCGWWPPSSLSSPWEGRAWSGWKAGPSGKVRAEDGSASWNGCPGSGCPST